MNYYQPLATCVSRAESVFQLMKNKQIGKLKLPPARRGLKLCGNGAMLSARIQYRLLVPTFSRGNQSPDKSGRSSWRAHKILARFERLPHTIVAGEPFRSDL